MHKINTLLMFSVLLFILGCEDKKTSNHDIPIENTTEVLNQTSSDANGESHLNRFKVHKNETKETHNTPSENLSDTFTLSNLKNTSYSVAVSNQNVTFQETTQESTKDIVLVTFFATWCPPCVQNIPYMNDLHKKYKKDLLLAGVLVQDTPVKEKLRSFLAKHAVTYFVSNSRDNNDFASLVAKTLHLPKDFSIPLTVMYVKGKYFTHYEGCVPVEMIEFDIQEARKMLKGTSKK